MMFKQRKEPSQGHTQEVLFSPQSQPLTEFQGIPGSVFGVGMVYNRRQDCSEGVFMVPIGHLAVP